MIAEHNNSDIVRIEGPVCDQNSLKEAVVRQQPYRLGGVRIQHEQLNGKHIYHNYGHGCSGIALAYGSALISSKALYVHNKIVRPIEVAVLGSGLIGLMTAVECAKNGHLVTIYSDKFPNFSEKNKSAKVDSQLGAGLWYPINYDKGSQMNYQYLSKYSYEYYIECMRLKRYQSIRIEDVYERNMSMEQIKEMIPTFLYDKYNKVKVDLGNGITEEYIHFQTLKIDIPLFLEELRVQAILRGVKFEQKSFSNLQQVTALKEGSIYNCLGAASKKIFPDDRMDMVTEKQIYLANPNGQKFTMGFQHNGAQIKIHATETEIMIKEIQPQALENDISNLMGNVKSFFNERLELRPKL